MIVEFSDSEKRILLDWSHNKNSENLIIFPEEAALIELFKIDNNKGIELNKNKVVIMLSWAESAVDKNFGSGAIVNHEEEKLLKKLKDIYSSLSDNPL